MFLKSLSMKGFKSFADPTLLKFEPGITVVVGPNGSGKSNVVDAVTWVLGAQGPRSLRSQKMEDVIFAGTASRPALGRAEVSLTIDNSSGKLPLEMAEVTITRTLFRSGDSEYAINGAPCRLLDIQELLNDSGVGRSQHMIIGQGQLDAVLNARPEDRRAIIEEAAGVLKHRRRRERAERRLAGTQENLERLGDLVREVRRQIRPLERQAAAARSQATLAAELRAVRLHLAGLELRQLAQGRTGAESELAVLGAGQRELDATLARLDDLASTTAAELSSRRDEDLAASLGRVQGLVERARGTRSVLGERTGALAAALDAAADVDVVSSLEAEAARLEDELGSTVEEAGALDPETRRLRTAEEQLETDERDQAAAWGDGSDLPQAEEALVAARSLRELLGRSLAQDDRLLEGLEERLGALEERLRVLAEEAAALDRGHQELEAQGSNLVQAAAAADRAVEVARAGAEAAEGQAHLAEQQRHRTAARAEALARALHELEGAGGREVLADVEGVVGSLVDLVEIDPGWEAAFEAAAGASVAAVVVDGRTAARAALERLYRRGATGALLAARPAAGPPGGGPRVPPGAELVRPHVRLRSAGGVAASPGVVSGALDALVGSAVRVDGWEQAVDLALERPDLVVVTSGGDRFAASGWRVRSAHGVVTAAAVEEARSRSEEAAAQADVAAGGLRSVRDELEASRLAAREAGRAADRHEAARSAMVLQRDRLGEEHERLLAELAGTRGAREEAGQARATDIERLAELEAELPGLEASVEAANLRAGRASEVRAVLEERRGSLSRERQQLEVRLAGLQERRRVLERRRAEVERRLQGHAEERREAAARRQRIEADRDALVRLDALVEGHQGRLEGVLEAVRGDYRQQVEAVRAGGERLESLRRERAGTERRLGEVRERVASLDVALAEVTLRTEALVDGLSREFDSSPEEALAAPAPDLAEGVVPDAHAETLAQRLARLGPVNPLALEELSALEERQQELESQVDDVRTARRELQEVVRTLDAEIVQTFAAAAADVNEHFSTLVATLFPGGTGRLLLTEPEDLLNTGVEVEVRPAGRNVRRVSLLSGGERSLAALAFLFAVFRSRPSPFYLMDEVEAALDDVNLHRFLSLVKNFRDEAQLIVVSHQKRTMETADALYGVTMAPGGSSQVVSQKMTEEAPAESAA